MEADDHEWYSDHRTQDSIETVYATYLNFSMMIDVCSLSENKRAIERPKSKIIPALNVT